MLRNYFPKGVSLAKHLPAHLLAVEHELNHRPRIVLQDRCPADLFAALLTATGPSVLRQLTRTHPDDSQTSTRELQACMKSWCPPFSVTLVPRQSMSLMVDDHSLTAEVTLMDSDVQLAHNLLGTVPLPRRHDLVEPSCPQRGPQDSHPPGTNRSGSGHTD